MLVPTLERLAAALAFQGEMDDHHRRVMAAYGDGPRAAPYMPTFQDFMARRRK